MDGTLEWEPSIRVISNPFFCKNFVIAMKRAPLSNSIFLTFKIQERKMEREKYLGGITRRPGFRKGAFMGLLES